MFDEKEIIKMITEGKIDNLKMDNNKENLKNILMNIAVKNKKTDKKIQIPLAFRYITAVAGFFVLFFITFYVVDTMEINSIEMVVYGQHTVTGIRGGTQ